MPVRSARSLTALAAAAGLLFVAGCGSSDDSGAGSDSSSSDKSAGSSSAPAAGKAASGEKVTISDSQNRTVTLKKNPKKVVVLDWSNARSLAAFGVPIAGAPKPNGELPPDLKKAVSSAKQVGSLFEPDYEGIADLEPDLVIVGARSGNPEVVKELTKITPYVIDLSTRTKKPSEQFGLIKTRYTQLASIFGKDAEAKNVLAGVDKNVAGLKTKATAAGGTTMFASVSGSKVSAYGPGSRFDRVWSQFGFKPVDAQLDNKGAHGEETNQEFFVKYNPSRILVLDRGRAVGDSGKPAVDVLNNGLVNRTDAAKNKKIVPLNGFAWYLAPDSPTSINEMVTDASKAL